MIKVDQCHTNRSFTWTIMHAWHCALRIESLPLISPQILCRIRADEPSDSCASLEGFWIMKDMPNKQFALHQLLSPIHLQLLRLSHLCTKTTITLSLQAIPYKLKLGSDHKFDVLKGLLISIMDPAMICFVLWKGDQSLLDWEQYFHALGMRLEHNK